MDVDPPVKPAAQIRCGESVAEVVYSYWREQFRGSVFL